MGQVVTKDQNVFTSKQMDISRNINNNEFSIEYEGFLKLPAIPKWVIIGPQGGLYYMSTRNPSKKNYFTKKMYQLLLEGKLPHCLSNCSIEEIIKNMPDDSKWTVPQYKKFIADKINHAHQ
jgi:hypothetical protein